MTMRALAPGGAVPSPCTSVCTMDQVTGFCAGCFRTLDEIAAWSLLGDAEKREVWAALAQRRIAAPPGVIDGPVRNGNGGDAER